MTAEPQTKVSALQFLLDLTPPKEFQMDAEFSLVTRVAESCEDPEDGARSALSVMVVECEARARQHRGYVSQYLSEASNVENRGMAAEYEAFAKQMRAVVIASDPD